jgi:hypothetical protein
MTTMVGFSKMIQNVEKHMSRKQKEAEYERS